MQPAVEFDDQLMQRSAAMKKPFVLCEGQTDPIYLKTAAELLGFTDILKGVEFDWIGVMANGKAKDGGEGQLRQAQKTLKNNPKLLQFHTILLFDCDQNCPEIDEGLLHVRVLDQNKANKSCDRGIENLLPSNVFEDEYFSEKDERNGADLIHKKILEKVRLCDHLCDDKRDIADFEEFRPALEKIRECLFPVIDQAGDDEPSE